MGDAAPDTSNSSCPARDWSQIPRDLLISVFGLLEICDLFACAAVSLGWRAGCAAARQLGLWPDRGPYLICSTADGDRGAATLHNVSTGRSFRAAALPDPPFRSRYVVGSSRGWLVTADKQANLLLLNPVTGAQIALPPPHTMVGVTQSLSRDDGALEGHWIHDLNVERRSVVTDRNEPQFFRPKKTRLHLYEKAVLSADPLSSSGGDCIVLLKHRPWEHLSFARVGDNGWTWLDTNWRCDSYHDFFYNDDDGLFYAIRANSEIHTIDLSGPSPVVKVIFDLRSCETFHTRYLVRAPWGDLLQIRRLYGTPPEEDGEEWSSMGKVTVHKVDLAEQKVTRVRNLQDHVLFVGFNNTFMLPARDFPNLTPNCVYMTDDNTEFIYYSPGSGRQLVCVNLEDGSFSGLSSLPDSKLDWPPPVWFWPSCSQHSTNK